MTDHNPKTARREIEDVAGCTCANLRKAARAVTQAYDAALQPAGLKSTQFTVLAVLAAQGEAPLTRLADALVMDRTTLTRNLKPLMRDGLIRVDPGADARVRQIGLTAQGREVFEQALPHWRAVQSQLAARLGAERWSGLLDDLAATVAAVPSR